jgi:hypothetical protein
VRLYLILLTSNQNLNALIKKKKENSSAQSSPSEKSKNLPSCKGPILSTRTKFFHRILLVILKGKPKEKPFPTAMQIAINNTNRIRAHFLKYWTLDLNIQQVDKISLWNPFKNPNRKGKLKKIMRKAANLTS